MNIGIMGNALYPTDSSGLITGYGVAVDNLMNSFFTYSSVDKFICLFEPERYEYEHIRRLRDRLPPDRQRKICLANEYNLLFHGLASVSDIDILHSLRGDALSSLALRESIGRPIPITITLHGISEQHLLLDTFYPMLMFPFKSYDAILCTSEAVRKTITRMFERLSQENSFLKNRKLPEIRLEKVPLGIDTDYFRPMEKGAARNNFDIPQDAFVILWLGRFSIAHKADLRPLIHVFQRLVRKNPSKNLLLILAGCSSAGSTDCQEFTTYAQCNEIGKQIKVIHNDEIANRAELYSACDVFTSPVDNIQETFGLTPVEAMSCGVPQVVSDWDGYRDTVVDGETGYLIPTAWINCMDDLKSRDFLPFDGARRRELYASLVSRSVAIDCDVYEDRLQKLIDYPQLLAKMGANSRTRAKTCFDNRRTVTLTEEVWCALCDRAHVSGENMHFCKMTVLDYCGDFLAYPSRMLTDESRFIVTPYGAKYKLKIDKSRKIATEEDALPSELLHLFHSANTYCPNELFVLFPQYTHSQIKRSMMYLYKNGLIRPTQPLC